MKRRVLLVEDDAPSAQMLASLLREDGYEVDVLHDGAEAIERLDRSADFDALVVDYRLPRADGLAVATRGRSRHPGLHVVMVTSYPELVVRLDQIFDPPVVVLAKPLVYDDLVRELERTVRA